MNKILSRRRVVISLGGSLVVPNSGIDTQFLSEFDKFIREKLAEDPNFQFFIIVGGGATARHYRDAGRDVVGHELPLDDLDWLGVHATRLNGHLIRTIFKDIAHPVMLNEYDVIRKAEESVVVGAGWKPGWSTDYCAVLTCENYQVETMVNLSNVAQVYSKDPKENSDAEPIEKMKWHELQELVGEEWSPGLHAPFDPIASKRAAEIGLRVLIIKGGDFPNLDKAISGKEFFGTVIEG